MMTSLVAAVFFLLTPQMPLSVSTTDDARAIFANPAGLGAGHKAELYYFYNARRTEFTRNHTFCLNLGGLAGFWEPRPRRYGLALAGGSHGVTSGLRLVRDTITRWDLGAMVRPWRWLSVGAVWSDWTRNWGQVQVGTALRPVGRRLTLFAETQSVAWHRYAVGFEAEPVDGIELAARILPGTDLNDTRFCAGITLGLGKAGVGALFGRRPDELGLALRLGSEKKRTVVPGPRRYLEVKLHERIADQAPGFSLMGSGSVRRTWDLLDMVRRATEDRAIRALVLELDGASMAFAQAEELRAALARFRASGRQVFVYAPSLDVVGYYVASVADRIVGHPLGNVWIPGVSAQVVFLKGTLDKLGMKVNYTRHGRYKSAVEAFSEDSLTPANREQWQALVDGVYEEFARAVTDGRRLPRETVEARIEQGFYVTHQARAAGLLDTVCYRDELDSVLRPQLAGLRRLAERDFTGEEQYQCDWQDLPAIAIIYASGSIRAGESGTDFLTGEQSMGSATMVRAIRAARRDRRVKAIVLRIDSPGGDGFASDVIWHEIELARRKKPVIVSMGGMAASGGYYIACNARRVFALPATLTGSIGVFSLKFVTEGLYNKLGLRRQTLKRGERADAMSDAREFTPAEDSLMQEIVDGFYRQFVAKVARGRGLTEEQVDSVGQGRVWTGADARAAGIVDSLGGLLEAVEYARQEAGLKECRYVFYPRPRTDFLSRVGGFAREQLLNVRYE